MSLYEELESIDAGEARLAVGTVFAFADSDETDNSAFMDTLSSNVFEIPALGEVYDAMVDGITTTQ